jgi:polyhydroxyalkanoate synthesis regulator phasin
MAAPTEDHPAAAGADPADRVGEALRAAVERTLAATSAPAAETRQRAAELLDEVVRRSRSAREQATRRGEAAREEVVRRGEQAGERIADVFSDLRPADGDALETIAARLEALELRLSGLERRLRTEQASERPSGGQSNPEPEAEARPSEPASGAG